MQNKPYVHIGDCNDVKDWFLSHPYQVLIAEALIEKKPTEEIRNIFNQHPVDLNFVIRKGFCKITSDETPMTYAIKNNSYEIIPLLIELGARLDYDASGVSKPLILAAFSGKINMIDLLVKTEDDIPKDTISEICVKYKSANINGKPLDHNTLKSLSKCVENLLDMGAHIENLDADYIFRNFPLESTKSLQKLIDQNKNL